MEHDISNKALAICAIITILVILFCTAITVSQVTRLSRPQLTGHATDSDQGLTTISITSVASIRFSVNTINFGTGSINASGNHSCSLSTGTPNGSRDSSTHCIGFNPPVMLNSLRLENDGTLNMSVNLSSDKDAAGLIGGAQPRFRFHVSTDENGSCASPEPADWQDVNTTSMGICTSPGGLNYLDVADSLLVDINVTIPISTPIGDHTAIITATGTGLS